MTMLQAGRQLGHIVEALQGMGFEPVTPGTPWRLNEPGSDMAAVSAAVTLVGAAALALWLIVVALGMRSPHSAERGTPEQP
ncbi:hypothetical protein [Arthrobacter sp. NPDC056493]|uniref:hypothetical protein n=1 Tax=Arthrobacter sp. NPDC056493 TaxID=3345839 RepID=UPI00366AB32C